MLVSVICPEGRRLYETVQSVLEAGDHGEPGGHGEPPVQVEVVAVGRGAAVCLADVEDARLRLVTPRGDRRNDGGRAARGEALMVVPAGDTLEPEALRALAGGLAEGYDLAYSDLVVCEGSVERTVRLPAYSREAVEAGRVLPVSYLTRRSLWRRLAGWKRTPNPDLDFLLRAAELGARIAHVPRAVYRQRWAASAWGKPPTVAVEQGGFCEEAH